MTTSELVLALCKSENISVAELARQMGQSKQNIYKKLRRETLTFEELNQIASIFDIRFEQSFVLPDGTRISN